ncbi:uncharacterized protein [Halyomorpha halys]|uniref:uncharacterized protein n=1 Tax=Halyomorpha halys TaxID=286706 RepID=UPI0006D52557|nr:uncharacterized protein LOC106690382 [Halyomorpha halys]
MVQSSFITACLLTVVAVVSTSEGYFWYGSSSRKVGTERSREPGQYQGGYRAEQPWPPQYYDSPMTVALPLAVPISPPMAPVSSGPIKGQPVQLVPCLCPISREDQQQQSAFIVSPVQQPQQQAPQASTGSRR